MMSSDKGEDQPEITGSEFDDGKKLLKTLEGGEEQLDRLKRTIKVLRGISSDGEQLTFYQAFSMACRYVEIYERFIASKASIKEFEVRVNETKISRTILNRPDGGREFMFRRALPEGTVLQIWRLADQQFDEVPLLFQDLEGIPDEGVSRTEHYGSGQSVTLQVNKDQNGEFMIKLSFEVADDPFRKKVTEPYEVADQKYETETARPGRSKLPYDHRPSVPAYMYGGVSKPARWASAAVLLILLPGGFTLGSRYSTSVPDAGRARAGINQQMGAARESQSRTLASKVDKALPSSNTEALTEGEQITSKEIYVQRGEIARVKVTAMASPINELSTEPTVGVALSSSTTKNVEAIAPTLQTGTYADLDRLSIAKLAGIQRIYLEEVDASQLNKEARVNLREEFAKKLVEDAIEVLKEDSMSSADGVVSLRFELNEIYGGLVFAVLRDSKGQYIGDYKVRCKMPTTENSEPTIGEASRLLGEMVVTAIQQAKRSAGAEASTKGGTEKNPTSVNNSGEAQEAR